MKPRDVHKFGTDELDIEVLQLRRKLFEVRSQRVTERIQDTSQFKAKIKKGYRPTADGEASPPGRGQLMSHLKEINVFQETASRTTRSRVSPTSGTSRAPSRSTISSSTTSTASTFESERGLHVHDDRQRGKKLGDHRRDRRVSSHFKDQVVDTRSRVGSHLPGELTRVAGRAGKQLQD